jgi:tartronate-semialdehyde synthase
MKTGEAIIKILELEGVEAAFGIPGASINGLYKYLGQSNTIAFCHRHEEACVHAAGGYYRASGKIALAFALPDREQQILLPGFIHVI